MTRDNTERHRKPNRLINERSPYLLEHAYNPVDWYPWGKEAFEKAKSEDKPIFLSIGYSACHWCHVFRRESLEDPHIAQILNESFVAIKVDREERPDVDEVYMKAVQSMTGYAGWPLNVFLTPALEPFYGGTYFPPVSRGGVTGLTTVLTSIANAWKNDKSKIEQSGSEMTNALKELYETETESDDTPEESLFDSCFTDIASTFDQKYGGFGNAPKFPTPSKLLFLLRYSKLNVQKAPLPIVTKTLEMMANGGIHDHIGGGFHRYSTDREWLVPHFEKMLYDNAFLALTYTEAYLVTRDEQFKKVVEDTLGWVTREMTSGTGGFFSAQDADSSEGEGTYYLWSQDDIRNALSLQSSLTKDTLERDTRIISDYFGITKEGKYDYGKSILTVSKERLQELATKNALSLSSVISIVERAKDFLLEFRYQRPRPATDDKILTSWNGLMISAMAKAYQATKNQEFLAVAEKSANLILDHLSISQNGNKPCLLHRYREGDWSGGGLLEDYAYFVNGLIDLYESNFSLNYLREAIRLAEVMINEFSDGSHGGFFTTSIKVKDLIARPKDAFDGALPSANSAAALALFRLAEFTGKDEFAKKAEGVVRAFSDKIQREPSAFSFMLCALFFKLSKPKEIVLSGNNDSSQFLALVNKLRTEYLPNCVVFYAENEARGLSPLLEGRIAGPEDPALAYVCRRSTCNLPSRNVEELAAALAD